MNPCTPIGPEGKVLICLVRRREVTRRTSVLDSPVQFATLAADSSWINRAGSHVSDLTLFATPKPFRGQFDRIQRNAIRTWAALGSDVDVVLIGDDEGTSEACGTLGVRHVPNVERSPKHVPLLSDLWSIGQAVGDAPTCVFSNADIMFGHDLVPALQAVRDAIDGPYLVIGQRWDLDIHEDIDVSAPDWDRALQQRAKRDGRCNSPLWVDWFAFARGQYVDLPPFVVGRPGYDHWIVWHTLTRGIPVIDASDAVTAVHQHHDYSHGGSHQDVWFGEDAATNRRLLGDRAHMRHIGHATHRLDASLAMSEARGAKYVLSRAHSRLAPLLERTMRVRHRFGIDADHLQALADTVKRNGTNV